MTSSRLGRAAALCLRLALAVGFLSAVADRFGMWGERGAPGVAWGDFERFLVYTASLVPFVPEAAVPAIGWAATLAEVALSVALLLGFKVRAAAAREAVCCSLLSGWGWSWATASRHPWTLPCSLHPQERSCCTCILTAT